MKQYIALIWNRSDAYDRYWVRQNPDETPEQFIERIKKCYCGNQWINNFYEATPVDA